MLRLRSWFCAILLIGALGGYSYADSLNPRLLHPLPGDQGVTRTQDVRVSVRLEAKPDAKRLSSLSRFGEVRTLPDGAPAVVGEVVSMTVPRSELEALSRAHGVVQVEPAHPVIRVKPLDVTTEEIGLPTLWSPPGFNDGVNGEGVILADHESSWDIFHPDFFRPDGGVYSYLDVDGDGVAGPGDKVDLDGDGEAEATLTLLNAAVSSMYTGQQGQVEAGYQPDLDWLYVDLNGNGQRDFGTDAGFNDQDLALGEPIFVADDVDGDGQIGPGERLIRLGTSKVLAIDVEGTEYLRGQNLCDYDPMAEDPSHGTGAVGVAASGWPGLRRYTGVAPGADLLLISRADGVEALAVAQSFDADVIFYEWNGPMDLQDGSSNFDLAAAQAADEGLVQLTAAGNLAGADHVMQFNDLDSVGESARFSTDDLGYYQYRGVWLLLFWEGDTDDVEIEITKGSERFEVGGAGYGEGTIDGIDFAFWQEHTARDVTHIWVVLSNNNQVIPSDTYTLSARAANAEIIPRFRGIIYDDQSGWGKGASWLDARTDEGSALYPSTGDKMIAVGAYGGRNDLSTWGWGARHERRGYSGMGPRIDGAPMVDISAPDDPYAPSRDLWSGYGEYGAFGGTSGALPHAAGVATLLRQANPEISQDEVLARLGDYALVDEYVGEVPNEGYGYGKVRPWHAVHEVPLTETPNQPPSLEINFEGPAIVGQPLTMTAIVADPEDEAVFLDWDWGNDWVFEVEHDPSRQQEVVPEAPGLWVATVRARDAGGASTRLLLTVDVVESCEITGCEDGMCCLDDGSCGDCPEPDLGEDLHEGAETEDEGALDEPLDVAEDQGGAQDTAQDLIAVDEEEGTQSDDGCGCQLSQPNHSAPGAWWLCGLLGVFYLSWRRRA